MEVPRGGRGGDGGSHGEVGRQGGADPGSGSGQGRAVAVLFAREGARVVVANVNGEETGGSSERPGARRSSTWSAGAGICEGDLLPARLGGPRGLDERLLRGDRVVASTPGGAT
jgi:NAD(P)-dependent dehydrogenase (short-subunit alcohol dehydrogenase family)